MKQTYLKSLNDALAYVLEKDNRVYILGEDIVDPYGGAFKVTRGLSARFPERVLATPISENCITGISAGMAIRGMLPVLEIMFGDFITLCCDQIVNSITKLRAMYNFQFEVPVVIRTPMGGGRGYGPTHSQSLERLFFGIPHLKVIAPSHFHSPGELLKYSILEDKTPILFIEHKLLYPLELFINNSEFINVDVVREHSGYPTAIVRNYKDANPDALLIAYGGISRFVLPLLEELFHEEIRIMACIPSIISPPPIDTIINCVEKTKHVVLAEEAMTNFGWTSEIASSIYRAFEGDVDLKIRILGAKDTVIPASKELEDFIILSYEDLKNIIMGVLL